jgi:hypothetical protein
MLLQLALLAAQENESERVQHGAADFEDLVAATPNRVPHLTVQYG